MARRVILGKQTDGTLGMRCSLAGYDAGVNPVDLSGLSFASDWNTVLPIYLSGTHLNIAENTDTNFTFTSIGYIPLGFFMVRPTGQTGWNSLPPPYNAGLAIFVAVTYDGRIRIINHLGFAIDVAYSLFYAVTQ